MASGKIMVAGVILDGPRQCTNEVAMHFAIKKTACGAVRCNVRVLSCRFHSLLGHLPASSDDFPASPGKHCYSNSVINSSLTTL